MKKLKLLTAVILLPFITIAQKKSADNFILQVQVANTDKNTWLFLAYQFDGKLMLDSAIQKNGMYTLSGTVERPLNATLVIDHEGIGSKALIKRRINVAIKFFIHPGTINLKTDKLLGNLVFSGSVINTDNERIKAILKPIYTAYDSLQNEQKALLIKKPLSPTDSLKNNTLTTQIKNIVSGIKPTQKKFIQDNPDSYIALKQLEEYGGSFPDLTIIEPMYNKLSAAVQNTALGKEYLKFLLDTKNLVPGTKAPDFTQNNTEGNPVSLSSFKGKYVLIDFWASWCGPCRKDNPKLVKVFNDFKDKNFTILGVSLDYSNGKDAWLRAIKDDGLTWTHLSDLKHWDNSIAKLYSIHAIPQNFLIDPNRVIIAKGIDNESLRKKLEEILTK